MRVIERWKHPAIAARRDNDAGPVLLAETVHPAKTAIRVTTFGLVFGT